MSAVTDEVVDAAVDELMSQHPDWQQIESTRTMWTYRDGCMKMVIVFGDISCGSRDENGLYTVVGQHRRYQDPNAPEEKRIKAACGQVSSAIGYAETYCAENHDHSPIIKSAGKA